MKLIRKLSPKYVNSRCVSYAIFWCDFCQQEVEKELGNGKKAKSCGCERYKLISENNKGKIVSEETRQKLSKATKGENNPMFGKKQTEEAKQKIAEKNKGKLLGENNPMYRKKRTEETKNKIRLGNIGKKGQKNKIKEIQKHKKVEYIQKKQE